MSINCINKCLYQKEGNCTLEELPTINQIMHPTDEYMDCPYYQPQNIY